MDIMRISTRDSVLPLDRTTDVHRGEGDMEMSEQMETGRPHMPSSVSTHPTDLPAPGLPRVQLMIIDGKGSPI